VRVHFGGTAAGDRLLAPASAAIYQLQYFCLYCGPTGISSGGIAGLRSSLLKHHIVTNLHAAVFVGCLGIGILALSIESKTTDRYG